MHGDKCRGVHKLEWQLFVWLLFRRSTWGARRELVTLNEQGTPTKVLWVRHS